MTSSKKLLAALIVMVAAGFCTAPALAQAISPAPFTQAQSDAGRVTYAASCASCHGDSLEGKGPPALAGRDFADGPFGRRSVAQLYTYIKNSMPFCQGNSLAPNVYLNIVAFILQANGAKPGDTALTPVVDTKVSDFITGQMPPGFMKNTKSN